MGAVVVTSARGEADTAAGGSFELEVEVPLDAEAVQVTAVASGTAGSLVPSTRAAKLAPGRAAPISRLPPLPYSCSTGTPVVVLLPVAAQDPDDRVRRAKRAGV